jgi:hypothetical protein
MAGLTEFYCGWNEPSHASLFKWLEYTFKRQWFDNTISIVECCSFFLFSGVWNPAIFSLPWPRDI